MRCVLVAAAGADWESAAVTALEERAGVVVLRRCVDVDDLMAAATAGQADTAVIALDSPGLDASVVAHLRRYDVRPIAVVVGVGPAYDSARMRATAIGIGAVQLSSELASLPDLVLGEAEPPLGAVPVDRGTDSGRVTVVWGPQGAPGRTTVAVGLAADIAARGTSCLLIDGDPYGGTVAQRLGILDEVSGMLSAARLVPSGALPQRFPSIQRLVGRELRVVTGLPRPDRWAEVRSGTIEQILDAGRRESQVVVDTGFCLEDDPAADFGARPGRNSMTLGALSEADRILVVGTADPVGLSRIARGLVELRGVVPDTPMWVVVNRFRASLGWVERDVVAMVHGFAAVHGVRFLPDDVIGADRSAMSGRSLAELPSCPLAAAIAGLTDEVVGVPVSVGGRRRPRSRRRRHRR